MSLPQLTEFNDPVARFLEWHYIRALYLHNDDAAMAKAYPHAKKQLKKWEVAFISLPKDAWAKCFFMSIVGPEAWQGADIADDINTEMAMMHHRMAIGMPWTADQGLASQWQMHLEQHEDGELLNDETGFRYKDELPNAIGVYEAKQRHDAVRFAKLPQLEEEEINAALDREYYAEAVVKAADTAGIDTTDPEFLEHADQVIREGDAGLLHDEPDFVANFLKQRKEAAIKDDTVIKSTTAPLDPPPDNKKGFRVEKALLHPKSSKDRSKYKSAYFLWGQIKFEWGVGEVFKLTETQASTWAGVAKGQHTKDVVKVLVDVRAIERIKGTLNYRRLA